MTDSSSSMSVPMKDFLDAVTNPFTANRPAQVPDGYNHHTICLQDWIDNLAVTVDAPDLASISGIAFFLMVGNNSLMSFIVNGNDNPLYTVVVMPITANGIIQTNNANTGLTNYYSANYEQITGSAIGHDSELSLVDSFRMFGAGIRVWPTIEMITSSETLAVSQYYAGLMTPTAITKSADLATNFYNIVRQSEYIEEFTNSQGCCVRLDPFSLPNYLEMRSLQNWSEIENFDTSLMEFPLIVVRFTQNVSNGDTLPIKFMSQYWLEGSLVQPTPIFTSQAPYDMEYPMITKLIANSPETYPLVVQGHSFKSFLKGVGKVGQLVSKAALVSSHLAPAKYTKVLTKVSKVSGKVGQSATSASKSLPKKKAKKKYVLKKQVVVNE
jgi:hypothetical protein